MVGHSCKRLFTLHSLRMPYIYMPNVWPKCMLLDLLFTPIIWRKMFTTQYNFVWDSLFQALSVDSPVCFPIQLKKNTFGICLVQYGLWIFSVFLSARCKCWMYTSQNVEHVEPNAAYKCTLVQYMLQVLYNCTHI